MLQPHRLTLLLKHTSADLCDRLRLYRVEGSSSGYHTFRTVKRILRIVSRLLEADHAPYLSSFVDGFVGFEHELSMCRRGALPPNQLPLLTCPHSNGPSPYPERHSTSPLHKLAQEHQQGTEVSCRWSLVFGLRSSVFGAWLSTPRRQLGRSCNGVSVSHRSRIFSTCFPVVTDNHRIELPYTVRY